MSLQSSFVNTDEFFIEEYTYKKPMSAMHYHNTYELYYVLNGSRDYFIEDKFYKVMDGDYIIVPKYMLHRTDGLGATRILIFFSDAFLSEHFSPNVVNMVLQNNNTIIFHPTDGETGHFHSTIKALLNEYANQTNNKKPRDNTLLASYLFDLLFGIYNKENTYTSVGNINKKIALIIIYINENYKTINNIEEIAEHFFISKFYLCRLFNKYLGLSVITYLNMVRIKAACEIIKSSVEQLKMLEIAMSCGFNSSAYFCNVFKREMGISPTDFKSQCEANNPSNTLA